MSIHHLSTTDSPDLPYKLVPEGKGKIFTKDVDNHPVIGTHGCMTCVGVFFKIDDETCLLAHISAWVKWGPNNDMDFLLAERRPCTPTEGAKVKAVCMNQCIHILTSCNHNDLLTMDRGNIFVKDSPLITHLRQSTKNSSPSQTPPPTPK